VAGPLEAALAPVAEPASEALFSKLRPGPGKSAAEVEEHQRARTHSAMLGIVNERGYEAVTVRELARLAGVSTRTFYEHYSGKQECFLRTHELIIKRLLRRIAVAEADQCEQDLRGSLGAIVSALFEEVARDPDAARLMLIEAYAVSSVSEQVRWAERTLEARIADTFDHAPGTLEQPALLVRAIQAGLMSVTRARLLEGREDKLVGLVGEITEWAASLYESVTAQPVGLDRPRRQGTAEVSCPPGPSGPVGDGAQDSSGSDLALILSTVARLISGDGPDDYTASRICLATGISRERFEAHFTSVADCLIEVLEQRSQQVLENAKRAKLAANSAAVGNELAMAMLCREFAREPRLARLRFIGVFSLGPEGLGSHRAFIEALAALLGEHRGPGAAVAQPAAEASAGAIWGTIRHYVAGGHSQRLPRVSPFLARLAS
jgi:AcrR family transcriptional regulator